MLGLVGAVLGAVPSVGAGAVGVGAAGALLEVEGGVVAGAVVAGGDVGACDLLQAITIIQPASATAVKTDIRMRRLPK